ncbi:hypothetical protein K9S39_07655 [Streptomyces halobius]|uniref:DDE family transposase n=1 Tax=Streptomyces halobius TaxID=2879846 RepID=A0ABY4M206_9ACTN|nr:hypothetical protein [Streptomyces halobius]UQA91755.1 hypothetical protein K9S39_07655 [Streptomyces halobius]
MSARRPYRGDLSDARWALTEPVFTAWRTARTGPGTAARVHDLREIVNAIFYDQLAVSYRSVGKVRGDGGYQGSVIDHGARLGIDVEVVKCPSRSGFQPQRKRCVSERTFGWLMQHRRLTRDDETLPQRSRAMIHWAMSHTMNRAPTSESTPTWRTRTSKTVTTT